MGLLGPTLRDPALVVAVAQGTRFWRPVLQRRRSPRTVRHCRPGCLLDFRAAEAFALMGPGQTNPGPRVSPTQNIDFDVIYGRNLLGEWANWITVGLTVRIGDN